MRSMTGYGKAEATLYDRRFTVEIKSVNHRYSELTIKLPRVMNAFEDRARKKLAAVILRGKTDVYIHFDSFSAADVRIQVNAAVGDAYLRALNELKERYGLADAPSLRLMAAYPDLLSVDRDIDGEESLGQMWECLEAALDGALAQFTAMRTREGAALAADILVKRDNILRLLEVVKERAPLVAREYGEKLRARLADAVQDASIDEGRLLTEITLFADRACIDEELTRLQSHMDQLADILGQEDAVGRKLDFLVQEINREVNTIGSKSNDLTITKTVVELKGEVEKIREQVQNLE